MSKSNTNKKIPSAKDEQVNKLKNKLNDRKQQILRLKRTIRELEKKLNIDEKDTKTAYPKKDREERKKDPEKSKLQKQQELKQRLREELKERNKQKSTK